MTQIRRVVSDVIALGVRSAERASTHWWKNIAAPGLSVCCSACLGAATVGQSPAPCPKEPAPDVTLAWGPLYEGPFPDVIPALPPRENPPPPLERDAAGADDYPPPDRIPATPEETVAPTALPTDDNALAMAPPEDAEVIAALPRVQLSTRAAHQLLAINPQDKPYKVNVPREYVACGDEYVSRIYICVSELGVVSSVQILRPSIPLIDLQLAKVVPRWRYHPYLVDGRATAFCYPMNYRVR